MPSDHSINGYRLTMTRCSRRDRGVAGFVGIPQGLSPNGTLILAYTEGLLVLACQGCDPAHGWLSAMLSGAVTPALAIPDYIGIL